MFKRLWFDPGLGPAYKAKHAVPGDQSAKRRAKAWQETEANCKAHPEDREVLLRATERFFGPRP